MIKFQKKMKILLYFLFCVLFLSACGKKNQETIPSNLVEKSNLNSFFLENKFKLVKFKGRFSSEDGDIIERDVSIQIEKMVELKSGIIYKLKIQPLEVFQKNDYFWDCFIYKKIKSIKLNLQKKI